MGRNSKGKKAKVTDSFPDSSEDLDGTEAGLDNLTISFITRLVDRQVSKMAENITLTLVTQLEASISKLGQTIIESLKSSQAPSTPISQPQPLSYCAVASAFSSQLRAQSTLAEKSLNAVIVGFPEQNDDQSTHLNDKQLVVSLIQSSPSLTHLVSNSELASSLTVKRLGKEGGFRPRLILVQFDSQANRDTFLTICSNRDSFRAISKQIHAYCRPDYSPEESRYDAQLRREAGKRNEIAGKLQWVVRNLTIVQLSNPRELPKRQHSPDPNSNDNALIADSRSSLRQTRSQTQRHSISSFPPLENRKRNSNEDEMGLGKKRFNNGAGGKGTQAPSVGFSHFKHSPPAPTPLLSLSTSR